MSSISPTVVQAILTGLDEADGPELFDYFDQLNKALPIHHNLSEDEHQNKLEARTSDASSDSVETNALEPNSEDAEEEIEGVDIDTSSPVKRGSPINPLLFVYAI
ncbi:hypothetical protein D9611_014316 [Ephemerocybe angulata]|uniref:Uncharacterized protein n=1 Tax=Ephemerocybe angulata TaxID=980116 RepID=A0A8H5C2T5_9AGAR|nr:hypothetical protein D9611_014316 [Tulosesus angulatus]